MWAFVNNDSFAECSMTEATYRICRDLFPLLVGGIRIKSVGVIGIPHRLVFAGFQLIFVLFSGDLGGVAPELCGNMAMWAAFTPNPCGMPITPNSSLSVLKTANDDGTCGA